MTKKNLTDRGIKALKAAPKGNRYEVMDTLVPGLGVRVTDRGRRTFILVARYPGSSNPTRRALGEVGVLSLEEARDKARDWHRLVRRGLDPAAEEARHRIEEAQRQANSFAAVAEDFIRLVAVGPDLDRPRQRKGVVVARDLRREFVSRWAERPICDIGPRDVIAVLDEVVARGAEYQAHNLLGHVRRLFNWAIARGVYGLERSPCDRMRPRDVIGRKALRNRVLSSDELFACWRAAGRLGYPFGPLIRLLMLTGQRKSEVGEARWREFHPELVRIFLHSAKEDKPIDWARIPPEQKVWIIPAERMKADAAHVVPLTDDALHILAKLPHYEDGDYLFSTTFGQKPVSGFSKTKRRLDRAMLRILKAGARKRGSARADVRKIKLGPFVLHDLRRTMRTGLSALPIADLVRELVIAHARPGLHKVYDQHAYLDEKRHALELWAARLRESVAPNDGSNVVRLKRAAP
jgi:integrase